MHENNVDCVARQVIERLKRERQKKKISQMDLSLSAGLSQNEVNIIETGKRFPNLVTLLKLCDALQIEPASLFRDRVSARSRDLQAAIAIIEKYV